MNLQDARVVLTGATGGIGQEMAMALARANARLLLVGRHVSVLESLVATVRARGTRAERVVADLSTAAGRNAVADAVERHYGAADVLINNAGVLEVSPFEAQEPQALERLLAVNLIAPLALTRALLPAMLLQGHGRIVNVGSTFGSIGFPYFAAYSAGKFGLRGFSEALRRELDGTGVGVTYIAPRATRTKFNSDAVVRMNEALHVATDPPALVAGAVVEALHRDRSYVYLGWPEKLFVRLNALLPRLVDAALRKQRAVMRRFVLGA